MRDPWSTALIHVVGAPFRFGVWLLDFDDGQGNPSLLKMVCTGVLACLCAKLWRTSTPIGLYEFLTILACILGIASRRALTAWADKISIGLTGAASEVRTEVSTTTKSIVVDAAAVVKALPSLWHDNESGDAT